MSQDYSPSLVTKNLVFCGDAAMKSAAGPATLLYDKVNDNNGTMYNGTCFDFDGTDDLVLTSDPVITGTGDFTITAWINRATINTYDFICGNYSSGNPSGIEFYGINTGEVRCYILGSVTTSTALVADTWYHVGVRRLAGVVQLYINGVADGSAISRTTSITGTLNFAIGNGPDYTSENFDGKIADVKAFNVALSAANMKELYDDSKVIIPTKNAAAGGFVSQANLIGWWPLAEGAGDICYDGSGNGYHGIVSNEDGDEWLTGQTGAPQLVEGYNRPMLFDGSNDWVDCGSSPITSNSAFSWAAWINPTGASGTPFFLGTTVVGEAMLAYWDSSTGMVRLGVWGADRLYSTIAIPVNSWGHTCWTWDGTTLRAYTNGAAAGTATPAAFNIASNDMIIGAAAASAQEFEGLINEVAVYDTALTLAQVQALAATGPNGGPLPPDPMSLSNSSNVVGYWRNDGNVTWTDRSGNGNTGTVYGSPNALLFKQGINGSKNVNTGRDGQGFPLRCQNNGAIGFKDGSNDHVTIPTSMDFQVSTLLLWVKFTELGRYFISSTGASPGYYQWYVYADGKLQFEYSRTETGVAANSIQGTAGDVVVDTWYQLGVILDSGGPTGTMYKDGNLLVQSAWSTTGALTPTSIYAGPTSNSFGGQIGNMQIYNRALTYAEIQQNYNSFKSRFGK